MSTFYSKPAGLLLDFGTVITWSLFEKHRETEAVLGLPAGSLDWMGPLDPASDPLWQAMQRDELSERDYWAERAEQLGQAVGEPGWDMMRVMHQLRHTDPNASIRPQMLALVRNAVQHEVRVGILSNELELFYGTDFLDRLDIMKEVEVVIDGTHSNVLKPDPAVYWLAIDAMKLPPAQILFVDDQFRNIVGAHGCGLQTQLFDLRDPDGCCRAVQARMRLPDALPR